MLTPASKGVHIEQGWAWAGCCEPVLPRALLGAPAAGRFQGNWRRGCRGSNTAGRLLCAHCSVSAPWSSSKPWHRVLTCLRRGLVGASLRTVCLKPRGQVQALISSAGGQLAARDSSRYLRALGEAERGPARTDSEQRNRDGAARVAGMQQKVSGVGQEQPAAREGRPWPHAPCACARGRHAAPHSAAKGAAAKRLAPTRSGGRGAL